MYVYIKVMSDERTVMDALNQTLSGMSVALVGASKQVSRLTRAMLGDGITHDLEPRRNNYSVPPSFFIRSFKPLMLPKCGSFSLQVI